MLSVTGDQIMVDDAISPLPPAIDRSGATQEKPAPPVTTETGCDLSSAMARLSNGSRSYTLERNNSYSYL